MAWEWSHTTEAYENAELNLGELSEDELKVIYAEWKAHQAGDDYYLTGIYEKALKEAGEIHRAVLAERIWPWAQEQATCDNGGFNAWVCPHGCHTVTFDPPPEEEDDDEEDWLAVDESDDRDESPVEFTESAEGERAREKQARSYDELNGAPEGDHDR